MMSKNIHSHLAARSAAGKKSGVIHAKYMDLLGNHISGSQEDPGKTTE